MATSAGLVWGVNYGYDPVGNRTYTEDLVQTNRSEHCGYDNRDRLTLMDRGTLNAAKTTIVTPLIDPNLASHQQWTNLDRRGNWPLTRRAASARGLAS